MPRRKPSFCSHIRLARTMERMLQMDVCSQAGRTIADVCWKKRRSDCLRQPNCLKQSLIASGSSTSPFCALLAAPPEMPMEHRVRFCFHNSSRVRRAFDARSSMLHGPRRRLCSNSIRCGSHGEHAHGTSSVLWNQILRWHPNHAAVIC